MTGDRGESTSAGTECAGAIAGPEAKMIHRSKPEIENNLWVRNIASNNHNKKQRVAARTAWEVSPVRRLTGGRVESRRIFRPDSGQRQSHCDTHSNFDEPMDGDDPRGCGVRGKHNDCERNSSKPVGRFIKAQRGAQDSHDEYSNAEHRSV